MEIFKRVYLEAQKILQNKIRLEGMKEKRRQIGSKYGKEEKRRNLPSVGVYMSLRRYLNKQKNSMINAFKIFILIIILEVGIFTPDSLKMESELRH